MKFFKTTVMAVAFVASCFGSMKAFQYYNHVGSSLLMANVEALSDDEGGDTDFAKDYETGEGLYCIWLSSHAQFDLGFKFGMRINAEVLLHLDGDVKAEPRPEWKMTCQPNMGCYTVCTNEDWRQGTRTAELVTGCPY